MYYSVDCKELSSEMKQAFASELHEQTGLPVSSTHVDGSGPFIQLDRFGNDVTISRMTDPQATANTMEEVADKFFPPKEVTK